MDPIQLGLPHRPPFIFIDEVISVEPGRSAQATKCFSSQEPFLKGHFPGNPMIPGVLIAEALAQTAGIAVGAPGKMFLLTAIRSMKFLRPVRPEESLGFRACKVGDVGGLVLFAVEATVGQDLVAVGHIILTEVSREGAPALSRVS